MAKKKGNQAGYKSSSAAKASKAARNAAGSQSRKERKMSKTGGWSCMSASQQLHSQLEVLGLRVKEVEGDGSCLFHSIGDQLEGSAADSRRIRQEVMDHIEQNRDQYEPFIEDDEPFAAYCGRMRQEDTWAGHLELQAASLVYGVNISIHQAEQPVWAICNHDSPGTRMLHLSYHEGEHYNSVRREDDCGAGPPQAFELSSQTGAAVAKPPAVDDKARERMVMENSGCTDMALVRKALRDNAGDTDQALEDVVAALAMQQGDDGEGGGEVGEGRHHQAVAAAAPDVKGSIEEAGSTGDSSRKNTAQASGCSNPAPEEGTKVHAGAGGSGKAAAEQGSPSGEGAVSDGEPGRGANGSASSHADAEAVERDGDGQGDWTQAKRRKGKKPRRNQPCPCGSTRKNKNCCGDAVNWDNVAKSADRAAPAQPRTRSPQGKAAAVVAPVQQLSALYI